MAGCGRGNGVRMRPVIGITTYAQQASWGVWNLPAALIPLDYVDAVERAGGRPVLIPPSEQGVAETLETWTGSCSPGAPTSTRRSTAPSLIRRRMCRRRAATRGTGSAHRSARARHADARDLPRISAAEHRAGRRSRPAPPRGGCERRAQAASRRLHPASRRDEGRNPTGVDGRGALRRHLHHHQGIGRLGDGLVEAAWAGDGTLEGVEDPSQRFVVGAQWHPEAGEDAALFTNFVEEARAYRETRAKH